jgi:hypothetical protein
MAEDDGALLSSVLKVPKGRQVLYMTNTYSARGILFDVTKLPDKCFAHGGGRTCQFSGCTKSAQGATVGKLNNPAFLFLCASAR